MWKARFERKPYLYHRDTNYDPDFSLLPCYVLTETGKAVDFFTKSTLSEMEIQRFERPREFIPKGRGTALKRLKSGNYF